MTRVAVYNKSKGAFSCAGCLHAACAGARMAWRPWQANALNAPSASRCKYECYKLIHIGLKLIPSNKILTNNLCY